VVNALVAVIVGLLALRALISSLRAQLSTALYGILDNRRPRLRTAAFRHCGCSRRSPELQRQLVPLAQRLVEPVVWNSRSPCARTPAGARAEGLMIFLAVTLQFHAAPLGVARCCAPARRRAQARSALRASRSTGSSLCVRFTMPALRCLLEISRCR
jgi:hypothetical protein